MNVRRLFARAVAPTLLAAGLTGVTGAALVTSAGPAAACGESDPVLSYARTRPVQQLGDHGVWTYAVQLDLDRLGRHIRPTGSFDGHTKRVVQRYQRRHHLRPSGVVGRRTWVALIGKVPADVVWPQAVDNIPDFAVRPGDTDDEHLATLFNVLERVVVGKELDALLAQSDSGSTSYSGATLAAVKSFQQRVGIKASGIVGTKTWTKLYEATSASGGWGC